MQSIVNKNYFLDKLAKDKQIVDLISQQSEEENKSFFENLKKIKDILHLKNKTDKKIILEYDKKIIIPTGSEETLIRELHLFNKEMYHDFPEYYTLDFLDYKNKEIKEELEEENSNLVYDDNLIKNDDEINMDYKIDYSKLSEAEKTIYDFENSLMNNPVDIENINLEEQEILNDDKKIFVDSDLEKEYMMLNVKNDLRDGKYNKLHLTKPISISLSRYMKKLKLLKKNFIRTYGSELFSKITKWINEEHALYENIDRVKKLNKFKKQKINLTKRKLKSKFKKRVANF